ncbi:hypothetical protein [Aquimarina mytili]|uniref:Uncharacterized protein n=1 Tax=Aquimarina mytili TaxID=874423 RepID=A0A937D808_9FLAO|nr:hypothetical protein [Aquimarina mytili]MBL0686124.1 hypothetical protein [Aquimarina mytili]
MKILTILLVFLSTTTTTNVVSLEEIRSSYKICNESKEKAEQFYDLTNKALQNKGAIYKGYHGAALALKASYSWNPFSKLSYFNKGKKMIDQAIQLEPNNIELRMIRLSIQSNAPKIAGYYQNIEEDKKFMLDNIENVSGQELKKYVEGYISHSDVFAKP